MTPAMEGAEALLLSPDGGTVFERVANLIEHHEAQLSIVQGLLKRALGERFRPVDPLSLPCGMCGATAFEPCDLGVRRLSHHAARVRSAFVASGAIDP